MARGWGKSEEDLGADKEHAKEAGNAPGAGARLDAHRRSEARSIRLSLARIADQLALTTNPSRRNALESARLELEGRLAALGAVQGPEREGAKNEDDSG
jgi:hypothetical protein